MDPNLLETYNLAKNLKGKMLLMHGELDENVQVVHTMRLIDALLKARKNVDMFIFPNSFHHLYSQPLYYFKLWTYFLEHLRGETIDAIDVEIDV